MMRDIIGAFFVLDFSTLKFTENFCFTCSDTWLSCLFLHPCSLEGSITMVTPKKGFHLKGRFTQNCKFTHLRLSSMWMEALVMFSNTYLHSGGSRMERISPVANTMESYDGCALQNKEQLTINSVLLMWFHLGVH